MLRLVSICLAATLFQADEDAISKLKPTQALGKGRDAWGKKKGCHVKVEMTSTLLSTELRALEKAEFEGKLVRDFLALRGTAELYAKGPEKLIRQDKDFVEPRRATGRVNRIGIMLRNPAIVVAELFRFPAGAQYGADEKVDGVDCRILETNADEKTTVEQIKEISGNLKALEAYYIKDLTAVTDRKNSTSAYKAWISKSTLLPARLEWKLTIVVNKKAIPFGADEVPDQFEAAYVYLFPKYDSDLEIQVPPAVKAKLGAP
jgi:hypothetical protein